MQADICKQIYLSAGIYLPVDVACFTRCFYACACSSASSSSSDGGSEGQCSVMLFLYFVTEDTSVFLVYECITRGSCPCRPPYPFFIFGATCLQKTFLNP
jgi:hypothetical protein